MKKILVCPIGAVGEKRLARLIELELIERGAEVTYDVNDDVRQAVYIVGALDDDASEIINNTAQNAEKIVCYRYIEAILDEAILIERPIDACKLCDGLVRYKRRESDLRGLEIMGDTVTLHGERIELSKKELELLKLLYSKNGEVLDRAEAQRTVFPGESDSNVVDVYISYLRKKIDMRFDTRTIVTVRNKGYAIKL
jgi:hypothetical protein